MRTAVGLELKAVRVIRRGDDQRVLVPVRNGHLADHCLGEECNPGIGEECNWESEKNATQESWLTRCGPSRT